MSVPFFTYGPEPAVEGLDLLARRRVGAHRPGQAQQLEGLLEGHGLGCHGLEQRRRAGPVAAVDRLAELDVGAEATRAHEHGEPARRGRCRASRSPDGAASSSSARSTRELVGGEVLGDRGAVLAALEIRARSGPRAPPRPPRRRPTPMGMEFTSRASISPRCDATSSLRPAGRCRRRAPAPLAVPLPARRAVAASAGRGTRRPRRCSGRARPRRSRSGSAREAPPALPWAISSRSSSMAAVKP